MRGTRRPTFCLLHPTLPLPDPASWKEALCLTLYSCCLTSCYR
ncbi:hypothetical protein AK973_1423 [Pseudomonas brassicacearum]|nr:hypothetical protein AK973_1423 [Pseudomonas brassicacearum]